MDGSFAPCAEDFLTITGEAVWCTATTVDAAGRPRSRILHPIFEVAQERPIGCVATTRTPVKSARLAPNPRVAVAYRRPARQTVVADCVALRVDDEAGKRHVLGIFPATPTPLGSPLAGPRMEDPTRPPSTPLWLDPWRVQDLRFRGGQHGVAQRTWRTMGKGRRMVTVVDGRDRPSGLGGEAARPDRVEASRLGGASARAPPFSRARR